MNLNKKKPKRSLRTILIVWFLIFSILPLGFVTLYSMFKFEKAINRELSQRLSGNAREIETIIGDFENILEDKREKYFNDPNLIYHLSVSDGNVIRGLSMNWLKQDIVNSLTFFNRDGRMVASSFKDEKQIVRNMVPINEAIFLSSKYMSELESKSVFNIIEYNDQLNKVSLIVISKVMGNSERLIGYLEQVIELDSQFLSKLKNRMKLEMFLIGEKAQVVVGTNKDFYLYPAQYFKKFLQNTNDSFFDLTIRKNPYGFVIYPLKWGTTRVNIALGASKSEAEAVINNVNYAFLTVIGAVTILLIFTTYVASSFVLKPLYELVDALQSFENQEQAITIPVKNDTEIGLLTESFNEMSKKIWQARADLRKKINELESANKELREAQTKLVHSAKMISLGQLVAGVAHELNNPIGFINSNMTHLQDYADKLIELVDVAEKNPEQLKNKKQEVDFEYIQKDLPKLVSSCQEGARRTKDIVLGLRNFSRLEEAKLQEVDIHQSLETTLNLLQGEIKNRIQIHKQYEQLPLVHCYGSQINQVLMNILSNAVHAIDGNGHIWISTQPLKSSVDRKGKIQISIQDSGKGMNQDTLEKIFDPFFTTKGVGQGTGLGLSISYGIIQNHGGEITVRSEVGVGTEFTIVLPIYPPVKDNLISFTND